MILLGQLFLQGQVISKYSTIASQIEHAQHLAPGTVARFGEQSVVASVQVIFQMVVVPLSFLLRLILFIHIIIWRI